MQARPEPGSPRPSRKQTKVASEPSRFTRIGARHRERDRPLCNRPSRRAARLRRARPARGPRTGRGTPLGAHAEPTRRAPVQRGASATASARIGKGAGNGASTTDAWVEHDGASWVAELGRVSSRRASIGPPLPVSLKIRASTWKGACVELPREVPWWSLTAGPSARSHCEGQGTARRSSVCRAAHAHDGRTRAESSLRWRIARQWTTRRTRLGAHRDGAAHRVLRGADHRRHHSRGDAGRNIAARAIATSSRLRAVFEFHSSERNARGLAVDCWSWRRRRGSSSRARSQARHRFRAGPRRSGWRVAPSVVPIAGLEGSGALAAIELSARRASQGGASSSAPRVSSRPERR